jgi:glycosyltransferase EpsD
LAAKKARRKGSKVFYTAHGFHFYQGAPKKNWLVYYPIERLLARRTDKLITINEEDYRLACDRFPCDIVHIHGVGVSDTRYRPVPDGERSALRDELGFAHEDKIILCVGELLPNKNQAMAIRAMAEVVKSQPGAILLIAGNGPERENLESLASSLGLEDHVRFLGYCTTLERYQRISDMGVSCSYREGLPVNIIEAMLTGNPVVATQNRGHNELVRHGVNGYLVHANDTVGMAEHMTRLLESKALAADMGLAGLTFAQKYTCSFVKNELRSVYFG